MNKRKVLRLAMVLLVLGMALAACNPHRVTDGVLRDTIFSVEEIANGYYRIWMTHDDIAGYCAQTPELGQEAMTLLQEHGGEVVVTFRDITVADKEASWWDSSECGTVAGGDSTTHMFVFTDIEAVPSR